MMHHSVLELTRNLPRFSLQELSSIRIITNLCNNRQLLGLILRCNFQRDLPFRSCTRKGKEWEAVQAKANELVSQFYSSVLLKNKILDLLWPMCYRILLWKSIYAPSISNTFLQHFHWTERGRIDNARTVRCIISNKNIPLRRRFFLGCSVCLSEEINEMWLEMPNEDKTYFYSANNESISPLLRFWAQTMGGSPGFFKYQILLSDAVECAIEIGLLEALKYLISSPAERGKYSIPMHLLQNSVIGSFLEEDGKEMGYFLFFGTNCYLRQFTFNFSTLLVLLLLLHSSEYKRCLTLLEERFQSLKEYYFKIILRMTFYRFHLENANDEDCRQFFVDVWQMIPTSMRNSIRDSDLPAEFLCVLIKDNFPFVLEKESLKKITDFTSLDKQISPFVDHSYFDPNKWDFLLFLILKEIVTVRLLEKYKSRAMAILKLQEYNEATWNRVLWFVFKVQIKNSNQTD